VPVEASALEVNVTLAPHQAALYVAEAASIDGLGRRWRRLADAQSYVDGLIGSAWFFDRWPGFVRCTVERRGSGSVWSTCQHLDASGVGGNATEGVILLADGGLTQPVVLHELAHLLLPPGSGHHAAFAETHLTLVRHEMGFFAFADYYHALRTLEGFGSLREGVDRK
jgi:hypothetical protein